MTTSLPIGFSSFSPATGAALPERTRRIVYPRPNTLDLARRNGGRTPTKEN